MKKLYRFFIFLSLLLYASTGLYSSLKAFAPISASTSFPALLPNSLAISSPVSIPAVPVLISLSDPFGCPLRLTTPSTLPYKAYSLVSSPAPTGFSSASGPGSIIRRKLDSLKLHARSRDARLLKQGFLFLVPKTSFYSRYLMSTVGNSPQLNHRMDTANYPLNSNLSNISVSSPIHDAMTLSYSLVQQNFVTAKLFSVLGNEITTLFSERQNSGLQIKTFYISDKLTTGIYILRLTVGSQRIAKRIQVL